jgi:hypothetical protein
MSAIFIAVGAGWARQGGNPYAREIAGSGRFPGFSNVDFSKPGGRKPAPILVFPVFPVSPVQKQ